MWSLHFFIHMLHSTCHSATWFFFALRYLEDLVTYVKIQLIYNKLLHSVEYDGTTLIYIIIPLLMDL